MVDEGIDTGPIIEQKRFPVSNKHTISDVVNKVNNLYPKMVYKVLKNLKTNTVKLKSQKRLKGTYYPKRKPNDGKIIFSDMSSLEIYNLIRALTLPFPCAFFYYKKKKIFVLKSSLSVKKNKHLPGTICNISKNGMRVATENGCINILLVMINNKIITPNSSLFEVNNILQ